MTETMQTITMKIAREIAATAIAAAARGPKRFYIQRLHDEINEQLVEYGYGPCVVLCLDGSSIRNIREAASEIYSTAMRTRDPAAFEALVARRQAAAKKRLAEMFTK